MDFDMMERYRPCQRAAGYQQLASEYLESYGLIAAQRPSDFGDLTAPKLQTLGHALELATKGWLVFREGVRDKVTRQERKLLADRGMPKPRNLQDEYSHNLNKLARDAGNYYLPLVLPANVKTIMHLNDSYWGDGRGGGRDYEYPESTVVNYVSPSVLARLVEDCTSALQDAINADMRVVMPALGLDSEDE